MIRLKMHCIYFNMINFNQLTPRSEDYLFLLCMAITPIKYLQIGGTLGVNELHKGLLARFMNSMDGFLCWVSF